MRKATQQGFTLIEMAIVLVVIGLILGMVFKGRELIASAKVKNANAAYNKVIAGMNTYLDRYGSYPGDGCNGYTAGQPKTCTKTKNGLVSADDTANDDLDSFFNLLTSTGILTEADTKSPFGDKWTVHGRHGNGNANATWIYANATDLRLACELDRIADDGNSETGMIRTALQTNSVATFKGGNHYDTTLTTGKNDCWALSGTEAIMLKVLP